MREIAATVRAETREALEEKIEAEHAAEAAEAKRIARAEKRALKKAQQEAGPVLTDAECEAMARPLAAFDSARNNQELMASLKAFRPAA
jgi:hypothetical protein